MDPETKLHRRRINAWCMYDWANSAFATTILAAVLPIYYSQVAGDTLPSKATATAYWSLGLSISLLIVAVLSPILGTVSDVMRGKKRFLTLFASIGVIGTGLLILVDTGDWLLASILFIFGRIGFTAANVFYDALLPHVARAEEQDTVSARGYAYGYLGGGLLLAINAAMIQLLSGSTWGPRLSFLSVAIWWAVFSIPILLRVPEPPAAMARLSRSENVVSASFKRLWGTLKDIRRYRELFKYLVAFLIYNDGIGTIISVAAIYSAELGFSSIQSILALLLVQFVGIPFSLIFGRLPTRSEKRRPLFLAFILFNLAILPLVGVIGGRALPAEITGASLPPYESTADTVGQGVYAADDAALAYSGTWTTRTIPAQEIGADQDVRYWVTSDPGARYDLRFNGEQIELTYSIGPDGGIWAVELDGQPLPGEEEGQPLTIDASNPTVRYGVTRALQADTPGGHTLSVINTGNRSMTLAQIEVLPPIRHSSLLLIIGVIIGLQAVGAVFALLFGKKLFSRLAELMNTQNSITLSLVVYAVIAVWGFFLDSVIEFWFLAWMVAIVQGGSQALSRSLYASMSPSAKSGEFFGLYGVMEKFSAIIGPLLFAGAATIFDSSRPAILSLIVIFFLGILLLRGVHVDEGRRVAREEDALLLGTEGQS